MQKHAHPHCDERVLCDHAQREKNYFPAGLSVNEQETESKDYSDLYERFSICQSR